MFNFSENTLGLTGSATREILKLTSNPEIISFAGGLPGRDCFPLEQIREIAGALLGGKGAIGLLQYGTTDGLKDVKDEIIRYASDSFNIEGLLDENVIVVSGGQQGLDLMCRAFLNKNDAVLVQNPTYLTVLQIIKSYGARAVGVLSTQEGLDLEDLEKNIIEHKPKLLYTVPTFSNPTGAVYSLENRKGIAKLARKYNVIVIEDDPYSQLRFQGEEIQSLKSTAREETDNIVFISSFSKIISPGLRVGFALGNKDIIRKLEICKQCADVHTPNLNQAIAGEFLKRGYLKPHLDAIRPKYKEKKDCMVAVLNKHMPKSFKFLNPEGGLFIWGEFENGIDTHKLFQKAIEHKVAYVYGNVFHADNSGKNTMRLNFSNATKEQIEKGIAELGRVFS